MFQAIFVRIRELQTLAQQPDPRPLQVRMTLCNLGLAVPFIDTLHFVEHVERFGLPVTHAASIAIPSEQAGSFLPLRDWKGPIGAPMMDAFVALFVMALHFGMPWARDLLAAESGAYAT